MTRHGCARAAPAAEAMASRTPPSFFAMMMSVRTRPRAPELAVSRSSSRRRPTLAVFVPFMWMIMSVPSYGRRQARPSRASMRSEAAGPQVPGAYSAIDSGFSAQWFSA